MQPDNEYWRRPEQDDNPPGGAASALPGPGRPTYGGPPPSSPPPTGWRPEHIVEPLPPRLLPAQDHALIDNEEARARTLSTGIAIVAGALIVILLCAVCGRNLF